MPFMQGVHYIYTVKPGDTLFSIANRFGSTVQLITQTNALYPPVTDPDLIYPGQILVISETGLGQRTAVSYIVNPGDSLYAISLRYSATPDLLVGMNPLITNPNLIYAGIPLNVPTLLYDVESGESLFRISRRIGVPLKDIIQANQGRPGFSPDLLYQGYRLIIPLPSSANILVLTPHPGSFIEPGQALDGIARAFEAVIHYQIMDDNGVVVTRERTVMTSEGAPSFGLYSTTLVFDRLPTAASGELWVYARSARDGRIIDLVQVKVYF